MKKLSYIIMTFATLVVPFALTSCSSDFDYEPGQAVSDDCQDVYFSDENGSEIFVTADGEKSITLKVKREYTAGAVTVPVVVDYKTGSFNIPESVSFDDGESEADMTITYDEFTSGMNFCIHIADGYANPYLEVAGSTYYKATLALLTKVADVAYATDTRFANVSGSAIYSYSGENKFQWTNFMGSGYNMTFTVDTSKTSGSEYDPDDLTKLSGDIIPLNYYTQDDYGYHFVKEVGSDNYVTWTPEGQTEAVTKFYFYGYYSGHYSFISFAPATDYDGYGYFWSAVVNSDDNYENIYFYLYY